MDPTLIVIFIFLAFLVLVGAAVVVALAWLFRREWDTRRNIAPHS